VPACGTPEHGTKSETLGMKPSPPSNAARPSSARTRTLAFWGSLAATLILTLTLATSLLDRYDVPEKTLGLAVGLNLVWALDLYSTSNQPGSWVAFLGDSTVMSYPEGRDVPARFSDALASRMEGAPTVRSLGTYGMSLYEFYATIDMVVDAQPGWVIVPVNLNSFGEAWRHRWSRTELAGFLPFSELPHAMRMDLEWWGVTVDRLILWKLLARFGPATRWRDYAQEQLRAGSALEMLRESMQGAAPGTGMPEPDLSGSWAEMTIDHLRPAMNGVPQDHPLLQVLGATLDQLAAADIRALVYVVPARLEMLMPSGAYDPPGLGRSVAAIQAVAESHGAAFYNYAESLPDIGFRDLSAHLRFEEIYDGPLVLGGLLGDAFVEFESQRSPTAATSAGPLTRP
jgi:hypothetical protein